MQTAIVFAIIAICAGFVAWRAFRSLAGTKTGCGCATCPALKDRPRASVPVASTSSNRASSASPVRQGGP